MSDALAPLPTCWCQARYCSRQVPPGSVLCTVHTRRLAEVAPERLQALRGIDPRGIFWESSSPQILDRLERLNRAVIALAEAERNPVANQYGRRAAQVRAELEREAPAVQARLINQGDTTETGPQGRRQ